MLYASCPPPASPAARGIGQEASGSWRRTGAVSQTPYEIYPMTDITLEEKEQLLDNAALLELFRGCEFIKLDVK